MNKEIFVMEKSDLSSFIEELRKEYELIGPVKKGKHYIFDKISDEKEMSLEYDTTILPPKKLFFPPEEKLFSFLRKEKGRIEIKEEEKEAKRALFGVHPCDIKALLLLDEVMKGDFLDPYYLKRREETILIAMNCTQPRENCFCTSFDTGPELKEGYDLLLTDLDRKYLVEVGTPNGRRLLERVKISKARKRDVKKKNKKIEAAKEKIKKKIETDGLEADLKKSFNHEKWKEVKDKCLFCGSCTHVCPTCFCYNVSDFNAHTLKSGERIRNWDSCLTLEFAEVALGGNFRKDREARIKQRIYHKLAYFKEQFGSFGCVGCGRCIDTCVKDIDITEVINEIRGG